VKNEPIVSLGKRFASPVKSSNGSLRVAPGVSAAVRVTETRYEELLHVGSWSPVDIVDTTPVLAFSARLYYDR